jgi:hypothetical protein
MKGTGSEMAISQAEKDDVIASALIELERMFTVLSNRFTPEHTEQVLLLERIETVLKSSLRAIE